jgi:hypothetical protein
MNCLRVVVNPSFHIGWEMSGSGIDVATLQNNNSYQEANY